MARKSKKQIRVEWDSFVEDALKNGMAYGSAKEMLDDLLEPFDRYKEYHETLNKLAEIHISKDHDYAGEDYLSNLKGSERLGIPAWKGTLIRIEDKIARLENFAKTENLLVDESVEDTLMDLANYAILALILYKNNK